MARMMRSGDTLPRCGRGRIRVKSSFVNHKLLKAFLVPPSDSDRVPPHLLMIQTCHDRGLAKEYK